MSNPTPPPDLVLHAGFVRRLAGCLLREGADADDAAQETFVRALDRPPALPAGRPWLAAVLRNVVRKDHRTEERRGRRERAVARPERVAATDVEAIRTETLRGITDAITALDAPSREVVLLRHYEDLAPREIASRLGIPVETVKSRLQRAHERLRRTLEEGWRGKAGGWRASLGALVGPGAIAAPPRSPRTPPPGDVVVMSMASKVAVGVAAGTLFAVGAVWLGSHEAESAQRPPLALAATTVDASVSPPPVLAAGGGPPRPMPPPDPSPPPALRDLTNGPPSDGAMGGGAPPGGVVAERPPPMTADEARRSLSTLLQERLRLEGLLFTGIGALAEGGHLKALEAARSVLKEEPDNAKALELEKAALLSQHPESSPDALATQKRALGDWMADQRRTVRLEELLLKWPSQSFWTRLAALRAAPTTLPAERGEAYVRSVAAQATVTGTFESAPLTEVLRSLEAQAALEILLDSALRASVPAPTVRRLDARGMSLTTALDAIAADGGWAWLVAGDVLRVVPRSVEGSTDRTGAPRVQRYYDVSDLLAPGTGTPSSTAAMGESKKAFASIDAILRSLRAEVEPSVWRDDSVAKLEAVGQTLVVRASVEIHDAVRAWLARQR